MILYFSGTGNSKYVASMLGDLLSDTVVSLNDIMKRGKLKVFHSETPFVVVAPIYAWQFPRNVMLLLARSSFIGSKKLYFVGTFDSESGLTDMYAKKLCSHLKLEFMGFTGVSMPDNYVINDVMPDAQSVERTILAARPHIIATADKIRSGERLYRTDKTKYAWLKSAVVNKLFTRFAADSRSYVVSTKCISCGKCASLCPTDNITLDGGKPTFGRDCMACYSCIHNCPTAAIDIEGRTENHGRYVCPEYKGDADCEG